MGFADFEMLIMIPRTKIVEDQQKNLKINNWKCYWMKTYTKDKLNWLLHQTMHFAKPERYWNDLKIRKLTPKGLLRQIVTGDEKWIHYDNSKRKAACIKPGEPGTSIPKRNIYGLKVMVGSE